MNLRLSKDIPNSFKQVNLMTFHSFGVRVLSQYGYYLGIPTNFDICNDQEEQIEFLKIGAKKAGIEGNYNWKKCLNAISSIKKIGYYPDEGELKQDNLTFINSLYKAYEQELRISNYLDFDDLLLKTYKLFQTYPVLVAHYNKIYPYVCIDELQDTNILQYYVLQYIINDDTKLLAVGDDNQVIYEWNGADYKRLKTFKEEYQPRIIHLPLNYRCPNKIVEVSNKLMLKNDLRLDNFKPNKSFYSQEGKVELKPVFDTLHTEVTGIAYDISEKHQGDFGQVTILARRKKLLDKMAKALDKQGISHRLYLRKGEFVSAPLAWLNEILHLFNSPNRERSMKIVIGSFNQIANLNIDFSRIKERKQKEDNTTLLSIWLNEVSLELTDDINGFYELVNLVESKLGIKTFKSFYNKVFKWFEAYQIENSEETIKELIYSFDEFNDEKEVWLELSRDIFNRLGTDIPLSTFLQELALSTKETSPKPNEVSLMTIHASKGQGFDHVYLIGMVDDELPSYHAIKSKKQEVMEEERRNCYVAITRASKTLTLSYAKRYDGWSKSPSRFLQEMELMK